MFIQPSLMIVQLCVLVSGPLTNLAFAVPLSFDVFSKTMAILIGLYGLCLQEYDP